jgi:hypothetical protein
MSGAIPPLPSMSSWRGAQLKIAQGQLYLYIYLYIYFLSVTIRVINSRRMKWERHAARMCEIRNAWEIQSENVKGGRHSGDLAVVLRIILK